MFSLIYFSLKNAPNLDINVQRVLFQLKFPKGKSMSLQLPRHTMDFSGSNGSSSRLVS